MFLKGRKVLNPLEDNLNLLTDMQYIFTTSDVLQKRKFINMVFDNNLYYQEDIRTPRMMRVFNHNSLIIKNKDI